MFAELSHEPGAEFTDLVVGFPFRVEICTSFAAAHVHWALSSVAIYPRITGLFGQVTRLLTSRQSILEYLLKAQKLENRQVHRGVKAKTAFIWSQGRVELHTVPSIDLDLVFVIFPDNTELNHAFGNSSDFKGLSVFRVLLEERGVLERPDKLLREESAHMIDDGATKLGKKLPL